MSDEEFTTFIQSYVSRQLQNIIPENDIRQLNAHVVTQAILRTNYCTSKIKASGKDRFDYLNSGQYATFLYFLSRELWLFDRNSIDATRVFLLNKALNGIDLFYEIEMPNVFLIGHTVGMVFAKATYSDYCVFHQGCTIGRNGLDRPKIEPGLVLYPNSSIIGKCMVRENTVISPGVNLVNQDTPGNCYVFMGEKGKPIFKEITEFFADRYFCRDFL